MDSYEKFFEIIPVETAEQLTESFRLRYEVYCVENAFEDPAQNPNSMETDSCDARALHSLLRRRGSDRVLGTVRLILPLPEPRMKGIGLPIQDVCEHELLQGDNSALPWASTAEISRFAVSKKLRSRAIDEPAEHFTQSLPGARRDIHYASLGLMQAIVAMAANSGVTHLCAVMEPCLLRMLSRLGIHFTSLGPHVGFHGLRQPCYSELDVMAARTWVERHDVWRILTRDGALWPINRPLAESFGGRTQSAAIAIHA